ncbi:MAG: hypothetical protein ACI8S6_001643 [Myxococcota bacterium]|jgi:hypothetical protein
MKRDALLIIDLQVGAFDAGLGVVVVSDAHSTPAAKPASIVTETNETLQARGALLQSAEEIIESWISRHSLRAQTPKFMLRT